MAAPNKHWKVLPHGKLTRVEDDIITVTGEIKMPSGTLPRRMTVVRLPGGRLIIYSAIALAEEEMLRLEAFGTPAFLIVPNDHHRLDAKAWKDRYPAMKVIAPAGAREKVAEIVPVDATQIEFGDPDVRLTAVAGTESGEIALEIERPSGTTLIVNDIIGNIRNASGLGGWFLRLMRFAGDKPHVPLPVKARMIDDKAALAAQFREWAKLPSLRRIVVSHGSVIEQDPRGALNALAATLA
jgi:hypothetical protein